VALAALRRLQPLLTKDNVKQVAQEIAALTVKMGDAKTAGATSV
jgi:hypothetical protein